MNRPTHHRSVRRGTARVLLASAACLSLVTACGSSDSSDKADSAGDKKAAADSGQFPVDLTNAWGTTKVGKKPVKVATVSDGDTAIALALGLEPVITPDTEDGGKVAEYKQRALDKLGIGKLKTFDDSDGLDYEAIAAEAPDVILGMNTWDMDAAYAKLDPIAPVVTFADKKDADTLTWQNRLKTAAKALGLTAKADEVIAANEKAIADAAAANPQLKGKEYTYSVVHPEQITFMSYADQDATIFEQLGLRKTAKAKDYSAKKNGVSLEKLDELEADILLMTYPFGDEGLLNASELETNKLFQSLNVVKKKNFAVIPSENNLASSIAYPDALSASWVVEELTPILVKAAAGK
ncbi:ABC transporter substrate-binding protein [Streptomyces albipurpureus]|uniref:ABC transporter substrate-binding protein n=1 Tax=Streptomyces albipurpureus TaxID=2897419 RepID=A0ABT0UH52_9ACTN|nr:ABC transporter substrate-binding protein [Streptomyces sp. CWNU-1]MCM2387958.1 ABC transporter substrate-binding protein [Streptomyces sp. CWNU-1]